MHAGVILRRSGRPFFVGGRTEGLEQSDTGDGPAIDEMDMTEWMHALFFVAQSDPLSGSWNGASASGWVGAGLLGLVLSWLLLKHLPDKDAQIERIIARHESELTEALDNQRQEFTAALERILRHSEAQTVSLSAAINKDLELIRHLFKEAMDKASRQPGRER